MRLIGHSPRIEQNRGFQQRRASALKNHATIRRRVGRGPLPRYNCIGTTMDGFSSPVKTRAIHEGIRDYARSWLARSVKITRVVIGRRCGRWQVAGGRWQGSARSDVSEVEPSVGHLLTAISTPTGTVMPARRWSLSPHCSPFSAKVAELMGRAGSRA